MGMRVPDGDRGWYGFLRHYLETGGEKITSIRPREQLIVRLRIQNGLSFQAISDLIHITPSRVHQIYRLGARKLKHPVRLGELYKVQPHDELINLYENYFG